MKATIVLRCFECRRFESRITAKKCPGTKAKPCGKPLADQWNGKQYYIDVSDEHGKRHYIKVGGRGAYYPNPNAANIMLGDIIKALRDGTFRPRDDSSRRTIGFLIDRYQKESLGNKDRAGQLNFWKERLGDFYLSGEGGVQALDIIEAINSIEASPATRNRYRSALSAVFTQARTEWRYKFENPFESIKWKKEPKGRIRYLEDDERERLLKSCADFPDLLDLVILALHTGARRGELLGLKWSAVDMRRGFISFFDTKNGEDRGMIITERALAVLKGRWANRNIGVGSELVFPGKNSALDSAWLKAVKNANVTNFKFHDIRHTFATYLAETGATPMAIAEALGHKTLDLVMRYSHISPKHLKSVVERMADEKLK